MTQQTVGHVYAEALFLLAQEEHQEQKVYQELNQVTDLVLQYPELISLLDVPTLDLSERISVFHLMLSVAPDAAAAMQKR